MSSFDIIVAGAGPAGLALASACAREGLTTLCVAPDAEAPWTNNFGTWVDEVEPLGLGPVFDRVWPDAIVTFDEKKQIRLGRAYGRVDGSRLREILVTRAGNKLTLKTGAVKSAKHDGKGSTLLLADGETLRARVIVDATGFEGRLLERPQHKADAFQIAYGIMAKVRSHPFPMDAMWFMDFRDAYLPKDEQKLPPTFLYAMPFSNDTVFLEETSLVSRPAVSMESLEDRLYKRMKSIGVEVLSYEWEERCVIPMNLPVPNLNQRVVGFGAAAGLVHPGSGFSVSLSLALAPQVASTLAQALAPNDADVEEAARAAWSTVWTPGRLTVRKAHLAGMSIFCEANAWALRRFLGLFFKAPETFWHGYLSARRTPTELGKAFFA